MWKNWVFQLFYFSLLPRRFECWREEEKERKITCRGAEEEMKNYYWMDIWVHWGKFLNFNFNPSYKCFDTAPLSNSTIYPNVERSHNIQVPSEVQKISQEISFNFHPLNVALFLSYRGSFWNFKLKWRIFLSLFPRQCFNSSISTYFKIGDLENWNWHSRTFPWILETTWRTSFYPYLSL